MRIPQFGDGQGAHKSQESKDLWGLMEIAFFWFLFAVFVGAYGSSKGRSGLGWFLLAVLISPLLAALFCAIASDLKNPKQIGPTPDTHVKCPDCREFVLKDASKCKHCGCALVPQ